MGLTTATAFLNDTRVSVRCHSVSRMALETRVPSVSCTPKRGNVEKKVSSTLFMSSLAFRLRLAASNTMGVSFSEVNMKFRTTAISMPATAVSAPSMIPDSLSIFLV